MVNNVSVLSMDAIPVQFYNMAT